MLSLYFQSDVLQLLLVFLNLPGRPLATESLVIHYQLPWGYTGTCCALPHCLALRTVLCWTDSLPQGNLNWPVTMEGPRGGIYLVPAVTPWHILVFILRWSIYCHLNIQLKICEKSEHLNIGEPLPMGSLGSVPCPDIGLSASAALGVPVSEGTKGLEAVFSVTFMK